MLLTLGDLKQSRVPALINLCPDDPRFADAVNRCIDWLLMHGSWWGTTVDAVFNVTDECVVMPGCVASLEGVRACGGGRFIENGWYTFLPTWNPWDDCGGGMHFVSFGPTVPTFETFRGSRILRIYPGSITDVGKKITFFGDDNNGIWVRNEVDGVFQDGEVVTLASPFVDTVTEWSTITGVQKDETDGPVRVFAHPVGDSTLTPIAVYEYWETRPQYQRYKIHGFRRLQEVGCCGRPQIEAKVKLNFQKATRDNDFLRIGNLPALELAMEALKAKDDGDLAKADLLLFGSKQNTRLGAIPLLQQELRTFTSDRVTSSVSTQGTANLRRVFGGFI